MKPESNLEIVQHLYRSFGEGHIPAILESLTDDVIWIDPGAPGIPYAGTYRGKAEVGRFFQKMNAVARFDKFNPAEFIANGDKVVVLGNFIGVSKEKAKRFESDWAMVWSFRGEKVNHFQAYLDTSNLAKAFD